MRLKSLKLAGFKSFANPTTFTFRHGITAIVGPNGCGKSNVIDAIRWVLGETSAKQLRGGAMSDVIFAGTQDKAAKSVASVELTFEHTQDEQTGIRHEFNLYQELSVRRQVNLDGRSDYFINGTRCRRRDVVDVFLGTGLGARSYAVIEQGMIGRIVESSPMQLREFIEEAAGVSRYQARREETQKKLEKTKDNLARLHDMQSELLRQQKTLSKQAESAQRYETLALTLADIEQQLAVQQLYQAKHHQQQQKIAHQHSATEVSTLQAGYDTLKAQQDKLATRINQEQWLKDDAQSAHYQQQLGYQQAEHQLSDAKSQLTTIEQQLSSLVQQRERSLADIERLKAEQAEQNQALETLRPQLIELTNKRDNYKRNEQPLQRAWHEAQNQLSRLQDKARSLEQQQAINTQAQNRHKQSYDKWQSREQNWQNLWQQLQQSLSPSDSANAAIASANSNKSQTDDAQDLNQALEQQVAELNKQLQQIERQREGVDERLSDIQPQAHGLQQRLSTQQSELSDYEKRHASLAGEYDTLHQILHPKSQQEATTVKAAATDNIDSDTLHAKPLAIAPLREQIELSAKGQEYAPLLDSVLALWLDSHVPISNQQASQTNPPRVDHVNGNSQKTDSLWQALEHDITDFLTYQTIQNKPASTKDKSLVEMGHSLWLTAKQNDSSYHAFIGDLSDSLTDKVWSLSQLIAQPSLALWQQCYLYTEQFETSHQHEVDTLTDVLKSLPPSAILLTADGWLISRQGTVNLSKLTGAQDAQNDGSSQFLTQRLQQRTRLQALEDLLDEFETKIQNQQKSIAKNQRDYDALMVSLEETRAQAEQLTRDKHKYQQQLTTQRANAERLQADSQRLYAEKVTLDQEKQELAQERQALEHEQQHIESEIAKLTPQIVEARATNQQLQSERGELNRARQVDDDAWQALQLRIQQFEMRLEHSVSSLARATEQYDKSLAGEQSLQTRHEQQQAKLPELQAALQGAQVARDEQQALLTARDSALMALKQTYAQQQTVFDTLQNTLQTQQNELARHATELALSAARLEDASAHTQSALDAYYRVSHQYKVQAEHSQQQTMSVSNLLADFIAHDRRVRPDKIAELESERAKLAQQLSKIGAVNLAAVAELAEVNERLEPLAQQTADIAASMQTLTEAIASIDETTKSLFMQTLDAVNTELANLFAKVFGGGQASLTLNTDEMPANTLKSEQWRAGLTLMAQPKGKRNSRLAVLSGGEKTLTALSLIFAIFKQHPAPFCVLDEVDAPLDDANVARFTSLIHELADDLQFIFISHNKLTMQIADELKGITMPSAGISTLVSVSLDEAARYVES